MNKEQIKTKLSTTGLIEEPKCYRGESYEIIIAKLQEQHDEISNLKAYAKHERSLGAEPFAQECHDLRQENDALKKELGRVKDTEPFAWIRDDGTMRNCMSNDEKNSWLKHHPRHVENYTIPVIRSLK